MFSSPLEWFKTNGTWFHPLFTVRECERKSIFVGILEYNMELIFKKYVTIAAMIIRVYESSSYSKALLQSKSVGKKKTNAAPLQNDIIISMYMYPCNQKNIYMILLKSRPFWGYEAHHIRSQGEVERWRNKNYAIPSWITFFQVCN